LKYRIRKAIDFPLVGVGAKIVWNGKKDRTCLQAKIILNALGPAPIEVPDAEALLIGTSPDHEVIRKAAETARRTSHPVASTDSTPAYRREMAAILAQKALKTLIE
jgi:CO/xanthine dehydrogenase FAD-binding subunit